MFIQGKGKTMIDFYLHWINSLPETDLILKIKLLQHKAPLEMLFTSKNEKGVRDIIEGYGLGGFSLKKTEVFICEVLDAKYKREAESSFETIRKGDIKAVSILEDDFPKRLNNIFDPPVVLYFKGKLPKENEFTTAVVGARRASREGMETAYRFSCALSEKGISIVSGMALGIDTMAHRACVDNRRITYAVLGSGPDVPYPASNACLYDRIVEFGGVISEFPPGDKPVPRHFPRRNRIISGLADKVLLVEAGEHSGSLITADFALEQGKDIYAVPGRPGDELSKGCNELIKKGGAGLVTEVNDLL